MTEQQAIEIMKKAFPEFILQTVTDYKNFFVFTMQPKDAMEGMLWINNPTAVEKETGRTLSFHPMLNEPKAYFKAVRENGHEIKMDAYMAKVKTGEDAVEHALHMKGGRTL